MVSKEEIKRIQVLAAQIRITALKMIASAGKGHVGGTMSISDAIAVLYGKEMNYRPEEPRWEGRDRFVMSKGHSGCAVYAALMLNGFFPESWQNTLNHLGTNLPSHCDRKKTPGIDMSTGSLGQGLSAASGIAWGVSQKKIDAYTYCVVGDGECQEGQIWEALMFIGYHQQERIIVLLDENKKQVDGKVDEILPINTIGEHAKLFGWFVQSINGHDVGAIIQAIENAKKQRRPALICLDTIKGKDCIFAEHMEFNHGIGVNEKQLNEAVKYLEDKIHYLEKEELS